MKIRIDETVCVGQGRCYSLAPEVYHGDDDGYGVVTEGFTPEKADIARRGALGCPEGAITFEE
jgi:ferredoxin